MGRERGDRHALRARRQDRSAGGHRVGAGAERAWPRRARRRRPGRRARRPPSTETSTCPGPSRVTDEVVDGDRALRPVPSGRRVPGPPTGVHRPAATCSSAHGRRSAGTDVSTPTLPQATPSTATGARGAARGAPRGRSRLLRGRGAGRRPRPRPGPPPGASSPGTAYLADRHAVRGRPGAELLEHPARARRVGWTTSPSRRMVGCCGCPRTASAMSPLLSRELRQTHIRHTSGPHGAARGQAWPLAAPRS